MTETKIDPKAIREHFKPYDSANKPTYIKFDKFAIINNAAFEVYLHKEYDERNAIAVERMRHKLRELLDFIDKYLREEV